LGNNKFPIIPDEDVFQLDGKKGDELRIAVDKTTSGVLDKQVSLFVKDRIDNVKYLKFTAGTLPRQLTIILPANGKYFVGVGQWPLLWKEKWFKGEYKLSLAGPENTLQTLRATVLVE
jgi:hypothetical protein